MFTLGTFISHTDISDDPYVCRYVFQFLADGFLPDGFQVGAALQAVLVIYWNFTQDFADREILYHLCPFRFRIYPGITVHISCDWFRGRRIRQSFCLIEQIHLSIDFSLGGFLTGWTELLLSEQEDQFREIIDLLL